MSGAQRAAGTSAPRGPVSSSPPVPPLPSIGAPLRTGWGDGRKRTGQLTGARTDKLGLWTAVALQNHFRQVGPVPLAADTDASTGLQAHRLPPAQPHQRRTLAQRMGLVPEPPPAPTEEDWQVAEARALRRETQGGSAQRLGNEVCGICLEPFYETLRQGQVILSCSHVFHENCFRQFERFTRVHQRADGADAAVMLACPQCRQTHYHKRTFFAGKALAQRAAVVRIQSWVRRYLAEKRYTRERLKHNPEFRDAYVQQRLAKLSDAWEQYVAQQHAQQEAVLGTLETKRQAAAAAYLLESDWQQIIARSERAAQARLYGRAGPTTVAESSAMLSSSSSPATLHECPICLEGIVRDVLAPVVPSAEVSARGDAPPLAEVPASGEAYVDQMRREYAQKRRAEPKPAKKTGRAPKTTTRTTTTKTATSKQTQRVKGAAATAQTSTLVQVEDTPAAQLPQGAQPGTATGTPPAPLSLAGPGYDEAEPARAGVILSCGHCFHGVCLGAFERYSEWRILDEGVTYAPPRCPLCRTGYAKHAF